jgi:hypothetical protein
VRVPQPAGVKGSLMLIQRAVAERWPDLESPLLKQAVAREVNWLSPLREDDFAEYSDRNFLDRLELGHLTQSLSDFWPNRGAQWDALGRFDGGRVLLVEAKAHIDEFCSPPSGATPASLAQIRAALAWTAEQLGVDPSASVNWHTHFYQYANRLAHLAWLRANGVDAWLAMVGFADVKGFNDRASANAWEAAYRVAHYAMGLPYRHKLSKFVIFVHPVVH